jgi:hypothetical protein
MKLELVALIVVLLTMSFFVAAWKISPVEAAGKAWIVDSQGGYDFTSLANALTSGKVSSGDEIFVHAGDNESLSANLSISLANLLIIGPPNAQNATIDVSGYTIGISAAKVFIWGLNITDSVNTASPALMIEGGGNCTIQNNTITGPSVSATGSIGILVSNSSNNIIALNTISGWDTGVEVTGPSSTENIIKLNTVTPYNPPSSTCILLANSASNNTIYWNNLLNQTELNDTSGQTNYYDDSYPVTSGLPPPPDLNKGNWISVSDPQGTRPYNVPSSTNADNYALNESISELFGDIDLDGRVNIFDAIVFSGGYGGTWGTYGYDPRCDLKAEGNVDIFDAILLARNFGLSDS